MRRTAIRGFGFGGPPLALFQARQGCESRRLGCNHRGTIMKSKTIHELLKYRGTFRLSQFRACGGQARREKRRPSGVPNMSFQCATPGHESARLISHFSLRPYNNPLRNSFRLNTYEKHGEGVLHHHRALRPGRRGATIDGTFSIPFSIFSFPFFMSSPPPSHPPRRGR